MTDVGATGPSDVPHAPAVVERFVKLLNITYKAVRLYPGMSEIPKESAVAAVAALRQILEQEPTARFVVTREGLFYDGAYALPDTPAYTTFARDLYARNLSEVRFHAGCSESDIVRFLSVAAKAPDELMESGGFEAGLWELDVTAVTVAESVKRIVDESVFAEEKEGDEGEKLEPWPPSPERADEIVAAAATGQNREQRLLVRMLKEPDLLQRFLGVGEDAARRPGADALLASKFDSLAKGVANEVPPEREELLRVIAEAVLDLEPEMRQRLVSKRLLGDAKDGDESVTSVLRELSFQELMDCVLFGMDETAESRAGVARAIRYMSQIGLSAPAQSILDDAGNEMRARGLGEAFVRSVIDRAAPRRIDIHPRAQQSTLDPVDSVLRLIDLTPAHEGAYAYDEPVAVLREEASRGLSDGDVVSALVTIATLETRPEHVNMLAKLVEDRIAYLLDLHEFEVAADAAATLTAAEQNAKLPAEHRRRMRELLQLLSRPESMRKVTNAMRVFVHESQEYAACRRLLAALGPYTVPALLEVLAEEQDMTGRKVIVDLLSGMADRFVPELAQCLDDKRWYFVRNVVAILGSIHDPATLQHLGRTLRHSDERVRRETIRAVAGTRDALATEMLAAALGDESAQNVQLAARYLGGIGGRGVVTALEQVARGEGRGNRDLGARVEAMEALGRIGGPSSLAVLNDIARQRGLIASRTKELRTAAEAAAAALHARGVTEGAAP